MGWADAVVKWCTLIHMIALLCIKDIQAISECQWYYWENGNAPYNGGDSFGKNQCNRNTNDPGNPDDPNFPRFEIGWIPAPPYLIDNGGNTPSGIFYGMFNFFTCLYPSVDRS